MMTRRAPPARWPPAAARETNLPPELPVCNAIGDNQAAVLGSVPAGNPAIQINVGTGGQINWPIDCFARMDEKDCVTVFALWLDHLDGEVLFSDGVTEACHPDVDEEFGEDRLAATLAELSCDSAQSIIESINQRVHEFTGGCPPADDITLVICKRLTESADVVAAGGS